MWQDCARHGWGLKKAALLIYIISRGCHSDPYNKPAPSASIVNSNTVSGMAKAIAPGTPELKYQIMHAEIISMICMRALH